MAKRGVPTHPKTIRLANKIGCPVWAAVGLLECFWHWCSRHAITGKITATADEIAYGIGWNDKPARLLMDSLIETGWVDRLPNGDLVVHDLKDHADNTWRANLKRFGLDFYTPGSQPKEHNLKNTTYSSQSRDHDPPPPPDCDQSRGPDHQLPQPQPQPTPYSPPKGEMIEGIYQAYPRKAGKAKARKAIEKALKKVDYKTLLKAVNDYANSPKVKQQIENGEKNFIPHPATWFNQERWTDDRSEWGYGDPKFESGIPEWNKEKALNLLDEMEAEGDG